MPWVLIDDAFNDHPKWASAPCDSIAMWVAAIAWCNHNERWDGRIPTVRLRGLVNARNAGRTITDLETREAIHRDGPDHLIHDFADWQQVERKRSISEARRIAGRKGGQTTQERLRESNGSSNGSSNCSTNSSSQPPTTNHRVQVSGNSTPENTPEGVDNSRSQSIADRYGRIALEQTKAKNKPVTDEDAYKRKAAARILGDPELARLAEMFPTAPDDVIACALHGEKQSLRNYPRSDELATIHVLRTETA